MLAIGSHSSHASSPGLGPLAPVRSAWGHRRLIWRLARRELAARYRGSLLGTLWMVLTPLMMLLVYTFVFRVVFKARWSAGTDEGNGTFALLLFSGLILFNLFAECIGRAPSLMLENVSYIKKVVFPLEIIPVVSLVSALFTAGTSLAILALFYGPVFGLPPLTVLLLPLVMLPLCLLTLGLSWFLAATGVFLRDIRQFIGILITMLMFLSPLFFPVSAIPPSLQPFLRLNPLTTLLEEWRGLLFWGQMPNWGEWGLLTLLSALCAWLGYVWFMNTRRGFADVV
jgi:lipopolysaccharide transport system permease protein